MENIEKTPEEKKSGKKEKKKRSGGMEGSFENVFCDGTLDQEPPTYLEMR